MTTKPTSEPVKTDFKIPTPKATAATQAQVPAALPTSGERTELPKAIETAIGFNIGKPISTTDIALGLGIFVVMLIPFFFAKLAITRGLQSKLAAPGAASAAGWMFFVWLSYTTLLLIVAYVLNIWRQWLIVGPAASLSLVLLFIFLAMRGQALKTRR